MTETLVAVTPTERTTPITPKQIAGLTFIGLGYVYWIVVLVRKIQQRRRARRTFPWMFKK